MIISNCPIEPLGASESFRLIDCSSQEFAVQTLAHWPLIAAQFGMIKSGQNFAVTNSPF